MYYDDYRDFNEFDELDDLEHRDEFYEFQPPYFCPLYQQMFYGYRQFPSPPPFPPGMGGPMGGPQPAGQHGGTPPAPPPNFTPQKTQAGISTLAVDPGAIRPCRFRYVYIWPERGRGFWAWLTFIGRRSVSGFRWNGFRWVYFGMDLRRIESFHCY